MRHMGSDHMDPVLRSVFQVVSIRMSAPGDEVGQPRILLELTSLFATL